MPALPRLALKRQEIILGLQNSQDGCSYDFVLLLCPCAEDINIHLAPSSSSVSIINLLLLSFKLQTCKL